jgi:hypothetical protein
VQFNDLICRRRVSITSFLAPGSNSGWKSISFSCLQQASYQRSVHSFCTSGFSFHPYSCNGPLIYPLVYPPRLRSGVYPIYRNITNLDSGCPHRCACESPSCSCFRLCLHHHRSSPSRAKVAWYHMSGQDQSCYATAALHRLA